MKVRSTREILEPDIYDILSAIWVFACNDENELITYEGIQRRLILDPTFDVRKLVQSRADLFRPGVAKRRFEAWKAALLQGRQRPRWIMDIGDASEREKVIEDLTPQDVFRSQFRADEGAPKATIEVLDWGLKYIERLRTAHSNKRESSAKSWQMWLVFGIGVLNVIATVAAALLKR